MDIQLNIVKTYPVSWTRYKVFRDFIQNFYDSVGYKKWYESFHHEYANHQITMWIDNITFSYEWLLHIGASTKTNSPNNYAGYFGEGFKIASLCALRDFHFQIVMESGTWKLTVKFVDKIIDDQSVEMMTYSIEENEEDLGKSRLTINQCSALDYDIFNTVLLSFYYPENPMIGELIWEGKKGIVHLRSKEPIANNLPYVSEYGRKGAIFCGYQMLGTNPFNLVVCLHNYNVHDRERSTLYRHQVIDVFEDVAKLVDANCACIMLEKMRRYWNSYPKCKYDIHSWSQTIDILVKKVSDDEDIKKKFTEKYKNIVCLDRVRGIKAQNERHTALQWIRSHEKGSYIFAKSTFEKLGYIRLEDLCRQKGGFVEDGDIKNEIEKNCFEILYALVGAIYDGFFILDDKPCFKLITNNSSIYHGMASIVKLNRYKETRYHMTVRYKIINIYIKKSALIRENFYDVLSTFIHELCHMFGSDASQAFSLALTEAMSIMLKNSSVIEAVHQAWLNNFDQNIIT